MFRIYIKGTPTAALDWDARTLTIAMTTKPAESWDYPAPFVYETQVSPEDIDAFEHVNNAVYIRWLTECAWAHSAAVGLPEDTCVALRRGMAVRHIDVELLAPARLHDRVRVANWLTDRSRLRATRVFQIKRAPCATTLLRGEVQFVCINLDSGKPVRMPPEFDLGYQVTLDRPHP
ncbi:MAG: thioesterase family protein [Pseudomonadota bacterium]